MSTAPSIEERLSALERQVEELKSKFDQKSKGNWIEKITGTFENDPVFDEIVRLGAEIRRAERPVDED